MSFHPLHGSIRKKLAVIIMLSALPALVLILILGLLSRNKAIEESKGELLSLIQRAAESQERSTTATGLLLKNLSKVPDVQRADAAACSRIFTNVLRINQQRLGALHLVDLQGKVIASSTPGNQANYSEAKHFRDALATRGFVVGEYQLGVSLKAPVIPFGCPVIGDDGQMRGVLLTSMLLDNFGHQYTEMEFPAGSFFGISDHRGTRLFRFPATPETPLGSPIHPETFQAARSVSAEGLTELAGSDGVARVIAYRQLRTAPGNPPYMYMFFGVPGAQIYAKAWSSLLRNLGILLLIVALTLASGWLLGGRNIGRRLEDLAATATRIGEGDLAARVKPDPGVTEIDVLARSFNAMALALEQDRDERSRTEAELREARSQAEGASQAKSMFLANMSHELRTPLNGLLGMLQLIKGGGEPGELDTYVDMAIRSGRRLTDLLSDLLDLSRIEAGRMRIESKPFALSGIFAALAETFSPMHHSKRVPLVITGAPEVPPLLVGDEIHIRQILFNLVGNAMKFTDHGEVRLEVFLLPPLPSEALRLLFVISDTGIGIPDDKLADIFKPFTQVSENYTRTHQGAGLGLAIVRDLVRAMRGTLEVDTLVGQGTRIYLALPFAAYSQAAETKLEVGKQPDVLEGQLRVLLVEDDEVSRLSARMLLERMGHEVMTTANGAEALDALRAKPTDIVLMDVQMSVMDGVEATKRIRSGTSGVLDALVPVVAMTAYAMPGDREDFLKAGMDDYVPKPVMAEALAAAMSRAVAKRRAV